LSTIACREHQGRVQQRLIVALNPELVNGIWDAQRESFVVKIDGLNVLKPASEGVDADLCAQCLRDFAPDFESGMRLG
jgi:hypothetical protein